MLTSQKTINFPDFVLFIKNLPVCSDILNVGTIVPLPNHYISDCLKGRAGCGFRGQPFFRAMQYLSMGAFHGKP
ncbi:hypothetical protein TREAZ_1093 [Leadbettera azotonutricia ZAS-9]|uniref:Uncharacterized protein n=1 Tax=Leadbettera azotonutricia (strain ATCC BAA-888 / DSM 13862 / ZAS-9) TaxID=545695 RepID=F5Y7I7_LEAAZ|nr:hypothetical protein TREAZ_1093 [Leadbettera azotonutricia ZAS-9]